MVITQLPVVEKFKEISELGIELEEGAELLSVCL